MQTPPMIIVLLQVMAAVLLTVGIRACGSPHQDSARSGLWIAPILWAFAAFLTAPAAAAWRRQPSVASLAVFAAAFLVGFVIMVTVRRRAQSTRRFDPTPGDES